MKASPLIRIIRSKDEVTRHPIAESGKNRFKFVSLVKSRLSKAIENEKKNTLKVKFDILTKDSFKETITNGAKLLHLTSDVVKENCIVFEKDFGIAKEISMQKLTYLMDKLERKIDVVGIAVPNSQLIGQVFVGKGFKHVLCFSEGDLKREELDD